MIRAVGHVGAMAAYALAEPVGEGAVCLAQNASAFPPSPAALEAGLAALHDMPPYPDPDWHRLRAAIADMHQLPPESILCGAGSMELINCLVRAFAGAGDEVLGSQYGYAYIAAAAAQAQARLVQAREAEMRVSVEAMLAAAGGKTRMAFVCNPGNPTGTLIPNREIIRLREGLPGDVLLVVDQAYGEFADGEQDPAEIFALVRRGDVAVTRSFSKAYGLAGARVGWGCFPPAVAAEVRKLLNPNNVSTASQAMAAAAVQDQGFMRQSVARTAEIRDDFAEGCRALGLQVPPSHTNFVLLGFAGAAQAQAADKALRRNGLLLRGMEGYGLPDCLRATVCAAPVMGRCLDVLKGVLA